MGGAEDAHVYDQFLLAAHGAYGFFLNRTEQFNLHWQWKVGDLVEEQGAAIGCLKQALFVFDGAGKAAFFMTEKLAFHQLGGDGAAVDRDKGLIAT